MNVQLHGGVRNGLSLLISAINLEPGHMVPGLPLPAPYPHRLHHGVGVMNSLMHSRGFLAGINWVQAQKVCRLACAIARCRLHRHPVLFLLMKALVRKPALTPRRTPIRRLLPGFAASFASHARASASPTAPMTGKKGMGLIMLILIGIVPVSSHWICPPAPAKLDHLRTLSQSATAIIDPRHAGDTLNAMPHPTP